MMHQNCSCLIKERKNDTGSYEELKPVTLPKERSRNFTTLRSQVEAIQENSTKPQDACFREVIRDSRKNKLDTTGKLFRHFARKQMSTSERPKDVSGVKLLINDHQNISRKVKGQLGEPTDKRMIHKDAREAGTCLIMQGPYLKSEAFGHSIDDRNQEEEAGETNSSRKRKREVQLVNI